MEEKLRDKHLSKKEVLMLKNRISAQKSRDRKKGEFSELIHANQLLSDENSALKLVLRRL